MGAMIYSAQRDFTCSNKSKRAVERVLFMPLTFFPRGNRGKRFERDVGFPRADAVWVLKWSRMRRGSSEVLMLAVVRRLSGKVACRYG